MNLTTKRFPQIGVVFGSLAVLVLGSSVIPLVAQDANSGVDIAPTTEPADTSSFIPSAVGTVWEYRLVAKKFATELERLPNGEMVLPAPKELLATRRREVVATEPFGSATVPLCKYKVSINGKHVSDEFCEIRAGEVLSYGGKSLVRGDWATQELTPAIRTLQADLRRGIHWKAEAQIGDSVRIIRRFDVLGPDTITVPAGTYNAIRVRFVGQDTSGGMIKRYFWFVHGTGVVKSHAIHYAKGRVALVEIEELSLFERGSG